MDFSNRNAVITGGAGRIGRALAAGFVAKGGAVALTDLDEEAAEKVAVALRRKGGVVRAYGLDVSDSSSVKETSGRILADFGHIDILVNNAGVWTRGAFADITEEEWLKTIDLNLNGTFRVTKAFLPSMIEKKYGRIINLTSIAGEVGLPLYAGYAASKGGVVLLTKTLAMELAKEKITVNCVSPGLIEDEIRETDGTWIGRTGTGEEVADAILFLASDKASFITGVDVTVDGGRILGPRFAKV